MFFHFMQCFLAFFCCLIGVTAVFCFYIAGRSALDSDERIIGGSMSMSRKDTSSIKINVQFMRLDKFAEETGMPISTARRYCAGGLIPIIPRYCEGSPIYVNMLELTRRIDANLFTLVPSHEKRLMSEFSNLSGDKNDEKL